MVLCCVLLPRRNYRIQALAMLAVLIAATILFATKTERGEDRLKHTFSQGKVSDARLEIWESTIQIWQENLWWGVGPGHFDYRFRPYRPQSIQLRPDHAHNDYLEALADWGLVGAGIVTSAWLLLYLGVFKTWKFVGGAVNDFGSKQSNKFAFVLGASLGLLAILLHSAVDFNMHIPSNAILAITLMALLTGHLRFSTERYWFKCGWPGKLLTTLVFMGGLFYLGQQGWRGAAEYVWLDRALKAPEYSTEQIAMLEKAFAIDPMNFETSYNIGEAFLKQSFKGNLSHYQELAVKAMEWYALTMKLNRYDGYNYLRTGMCLHWLGRHSEAKAYFERAYQLDPNGYFTVAHIGWHYVQIGTIRRRQTMAGTLTPVAMGGQPNRRQLFKDRKYIAAGSRRRPQENQPDLPQSLLPSNNLGLGRISNAVIHQADVGGLSTIYEQFINKLLTSLRKTP